MTTGHFLLHCPGHFCRSDRTLKKEKSQILAQLPSHRAARPGPFRVALALAVASLFGMVAAFGTVPSTQEIQGIRQTIVEPLTVQQVAIVDTSDDSYVHEERIQRGDTVAGLFTRLGVRENEAHDFLRGSREAQTLFRQLSPGKNVTAHIGPEGELRSLIFPLNGSGEKALFVERKGDAFSVEEHSLKTETQVLTKAAEIRYSLFGAADAAGIPDAVATQLVDIFGGDIDFHRDLRKGDRFAVTFETVNHLGKPVRSGRILAAEFVNDGKSYRAVWFQGEDGQGGYYTAEGKNIRKAFLRSPLEFSRITSGFTLSRFHPVLQTWRAHKGIDYGAPTGTRVKATGDATVEFVGNQGGYGKVVVLRHQGRYTTVYGHLSGFAPGLAKGRRIVQGDVIGFVGATGLASGPHLHYEFRINDVHQNPLAIALPSAPPLEPRQALRFRDLARAQLARLEMMGGINIALLD